MATRKKALFPTVATEILAAVLKAIPPKKAAELTAKDHAAIMEKTNKTALEVCQIIESIPDAPDPDEPKPKAHKK